MSRLTIGRDESCDWTVDDEYASRLHAIITKRDDGTLWLQDNGTVNGTWLNEARVWEPTRIRSGDKIRVGRSTVAVP